MRFCDCDWETGISYDVLRVCEAAVSGLGEPEGRTTNTLLYAVAYVVMLLSGV